MSKFKILFLSLIASIFLLVNITGCAAKGPNFSSLSMPTEGKSTVYIYRPWAFTGGAVSYEIFDSGVKISPSLSAGSYIIYVTEPGDHKFYTENKGLVADREVFITTEPNKDYFLRALTKNYFAFIAIEIKPIEKSVALEELKDCGLAL